MSTSSPRCYQGQPHRQQSITFSVVGGTCTCVRKSGLTANGAFNPLTRLTYQHLCVYLCVCRSLCLSPVHFIWNRYWSDLSAFHTCSNCTLRCVGASCAPYKDLEFIYVLRYTISFALQVCSCNAGVCGYPELQALLKCESSGIQEVHIYASVPHHHSITRLCLLCMHVCRYRSDVKTSKSQPGTN